MTPNPAAALDALAHPATTKVGRFEVRELMFGTLAILEKIGSPLARTDVQPDLTAWAETLYALTRPGREAAAALARGRDAFMEEALAWAETVTNAEAAALMRAVGKALGRLYAANPATDEPAEEDGSGPDPTAAGPTAGSPGA